MQRSRRDVEAALQRKGFQRSDGDHAWFIYHSIDGLKSRAKTKTSHGSGGQSLGDPLLAAMARQCGLTKSQLLEFVDCPLDRKRYEHLLREGDRL